MTGIAAAPDAPGFYALLPPELARSPVLTYRVAVETRDEPGLDPGRYVLHLSTVDGDPKRIASRWRWVPDAEPSEWGPAPEEER